jgi:hypothetical protein
VNRGKFRDALPALFETRSFDQSRNASTNLKHVLASRGRPNRRIVPNRAPISILASFAVILAVVSGSIGLGADFK